MPYTPYILQQTINPCLSNEFSVPMGGVKNTPQRLSNITFERVEQSISIRFLKRLIQKIIPHWIEMSGVWNRMQNINGGVKTGNAYNPSYLREITQDILGISAATPIFFGSCNLMRLLRMLQNLTGSAKIKMAATIPEVTISQLVDKLATKFQRLHQCSNGPAFKWDQWQNCKIEPVMRNPGWRPQNRK